MWVEGAGLLLLLVIAVELGWIIFKGAQSSKQSQEKLTAMEKVLVELHGPLLKLADKPVEPATPAPAPLALPKPSASSSTNASEPLTDYGPELVAVLRSLSISITSLCSIEQNQPPVDALSRLEQFGVIFEDASRKLFNSVARSLKDLIDERQQLLDMLASQRTLQQKTTDSLVTVIEEAMRRGRSGEPVSRLSLATDAPSRIEELPQPEVVPPAAEATRESERKEAVLELPTVGGQEMVPDDSLPALQPPDSSVVPVQTDSFVSLKNWVVSNLEQIMNRSLTQWSKPEELLQGAPPELHYTALVLDPDCKLVLVGVEDASQHLAFLLPGGHLSASYNDWFTDPKGTGFRVQRTVTPAVLNAFETGYSVLQRGTITQY
ncbi:MAG TPA: hypothetical protein VJS44_09995 [Pyrinomonadaceae bacterium]|nr:hypothetical protein [Pyrinomonadaceae bacterium]